MNQINPTNDSQNMTTEQRAVLFQGLARESTRLNDIIEEKQGAAYSTERNNQRNVVDFLSRLLAVSKEVTCQNGQGI